MVWVQVEELPAHLLHQKMFEALGKSWGKFLQVDKATELKNTLDYALIKAEVNSKRMIPDYPQIMVNGKVIKIKAKIIGMETCGLGRKTLTTMEETAIKSTAELVAIGAEGWVTNMGGERSPSPTVEKCKSKSAV